MPKTFGELGKRFVIGVVLSGLFMGASFGTSCERTVGGSSKDLENARAFCATAIPEDAEQWVSRVVAYESILTVHVNRMMALTMKRSSLDTKRAVLNWMKAWKRITGERVVTVEVEWEGVAIATGDFSLSGGDQVTVH